ncbi:MAG TPA: hypothetical protein VGB61_03920 [Pyrinomonadaceae bacterium]|jgi:hypothetical protein
MSENSTPPPTPRAALPVARAAARLLTFRLTGDEFARLDHHHLLFGLLCTLIVGMGRRWDDAGAGWWRHAGASSLIYIFILALLLWIVVLPLKPHAWTYRHVLTFVALTAPPALLYAIPVERMCRPEVARMWNGWFLAVVAAWRVLLLGYYLNAHARLRPFAIFVCTLLPVTAIVVTLSVLNLDRAAFQTMGGFRGEPTGQESAYIILTLLTVLSLLLFIPLFICYIGLVVKARARS